MLRHQRGFARGGLMVAVVVLAGGAWVPEARAAVPVDAPEFQEMRTFLRSLGMNEDGIAQVAAATDPDKLKDWFDPVLGKPPIKPDATDIASSSLFELHVTQDLADAWRAPGGPLACDSDGVVCPKTPAKGAWGPDFLVYATRTVDPPVPIDGGRVEMGAALLFDTAAGDAPAAWKRQTGIPGDFFHGFNLAYTFRSDDSAPFQGLRLIHDPAANSFVEEPTDAVGVISGDTFIALIPETEIGIVVNGRAFGFTGSAQGIASDTYPDIDQPPLVYADFPEIDLALAVATPVPTPVATPAAAATTVPTPRPSTAAVAPTATASAPPATGTSGASGASGTSGLPWLLFVLGGGLIAVLGGFLVLRGGRPEVVPDGGAGGAVVPGGAAVAGGLAGDPCPPLIAAATAAKAACDEATAAAASAAETARARAAEAATAHSELDKARRARETAETELEKRRRPPDQGRELGSSSFDGRDVHVSEYDLWLQEQARAAANAAHQAAVDAATTDAQRQEAHDAWARELQAVDGPDGLDEVRRRDKDGGERWVKEGEATLKAAQDAEAAARAETTRADEAATAAADASATATARADEACARAAAAAAAAADCITLQTPAAPAAAGAAGLAAGQGGGTPAGADQPAGGDPGPTPPVTPTPPTPPAQPQACPDGTEPRVTSSGSLEVELFILARAQLRIDGAYLFSDDESAAAIEGLETGLTGASVAVGLVGAVTSPVASILGSLGVPTFDTGTDAPTGAAMKALDKLRDQMRSKRKIGTWTLRVPKQKIRFSCRVTESCVAGRWVVTSREFVAERIGDPRFVDSAPFEVVDIREADRAWTVMTGTFLRQNRPAEGLIDAAARRCAG